MSEHTSENGPGVVSLDQLIALNDEIAALARSGLPLERGLLDVGSDLPGRLGAIAKTLGTRMSEGATLPEALAASKAGLPKVYCAVVEAGLEGGRLPMALEGLSNYARGYSEARRSIGLALWYPMAILVLAYSLFVGIVYFIIPKFVSLFNAFGLPIDGPIRFLWKASSSVGVWGLIFPIAFLLFLILWNNSGRSISLDRGRSLGFIRRFPWMGSMMQCYEAASFADLLALLVEHRVPLPKALTLAGDASGDATIASESYKVAQAVEGGVSASEMMRGPSEFPPLLRWLLATATRQSDLVGALKLMGKRYRAHARYQAEKIRVLLPLILLCGIGMTATMLYALTLFLPLTSLWTSLARQTY